MAEGSEPKTYRFFEFINRRIKSLSIATIVIAVVLGMIAPLVAVEGEPRFDPGGEIYDTDDLVVDRFSSGSSVRQSMFIVEVPGVVDEPNARDHDVLTADALREFKARTDAARVAHAEHLVSEFDHDLGVSIDGIYSIADAVDAAIPGGLAGATDLDVKLALHVLLIDFSDTSVLRSTLSNLTTRDPQIVNGNQIAVWRSPAFLAHVRWDIGTFDPALEVEGFGDTTNTDAERWLRSLQTDLRANATETAALGIAIDGALVGEEGSNEAAPYIFLAVALILLLVGALLRSYWAAMLTAIGLGVVMLSYNGINSLIQLKVQSPLIVMIVPIALISFGVDFFVHGSGRAREAQVEGHPRSRAYPIGASLLFTALILAAGSSVGAFLSNAASGIQAITEFGIAAAIAIALSYIVLGLIAPRQLLAVEEALGPRPDDTGLHVFRRLGFLTACLFAGVIVTMTIVMPTIGAPLFLVVLVGLLFGLPYWLTGRRNRKAAAAGRPLTDAVKGAGHGFTAAGSVVHFLARWRVFTVPVVGLLAIVGVWAFFQVDSAFEIKDFFSSKTDMVKSLEKIETHLGQGASGNAYIYVEGDLTDPETLVSLEDALSSAASQDTDLITGFDGTVETLPNAASLARLVVATPSASAAVTEASGVAITDDDGDGLPDTAEQLSAIYQHISAEGISGGDFSILRADQIHRLLYVGSGIQGTRLEVYVPSITDDDNVLAVRADLDEAAADLRSDLGDRARLVSVSGGAITSQAGLASFTDAMVVSLPLALLVTVLLAFAVMRSLKYALISMIPILLVVAWLYGFMYLMDYKINPITATIAAIAIGIGIDYATHFTVRFRQEFEGEPSRFPALRRAGVGTGGALALSALTSMTGFLVMGASPMPMFSTFGVLTAAMVFLALAVSLLVLPSLLLLVTPSRRGEERAEMEEAITGGKFRYEPHARETADLRGEITEPADEEDGSSEEDGS